MEEIKNIIDSINSDSQTNGTNKANVYRGISAYNTIKAKVTSLGIEKEF